MSQRIIRICTNFLALVFGLLGGMMLLSDLLPNGEAATMDSLSEYLVLASDVFFSLVACGLVAVLAKFLLWDCLVQPALIFASKRKSKRADGNI